MIKFILQDGAKLPTRGSKHAAGLDICANKKGTLAAGERLMVHTGVWLASCPHGLYLRVAPRSKLANKFGIDVLAGVVDSDYRGEICVILYNTGDKDINVKKGDAIAQLIPEIISQTHVVEVKVSNSTGRGAAGINDKDLRL
jgi:dUTP pyrophosphatase